MGHKKINWKNLVGIILFNLLIASLIVLFFYSIEAILWVSIFTLTVSPFLVIIADVLHYLPFSMENLIIGTLFYALAMLLVPIVAKYTTKLIKLTKDYILYTIKFLYY